MTDHAAYPLFHLALRLDGERCLVVGGGPVAARKASALLDSGAVVTLVAPDVGAAVSALASGPAGGRLSLLERRYRSGDVLGYRLVITATGVAEVDEQVSRDAKGAGVLVNAADQPDLCSFVLPAVTRAGDVSVAVSTGGVSPYVATWVRRRVAAVVGDDVADLARIVGSARRQVRAAGISSEGLDWDLLTDSVFGLLEADRTEEAEALARAWSDEVIARHSLAMRSAPAS